MTLPTAIADFPFRLGFKRHAHVRRHAQMLDRLKGECGQDWHQLAPHKGHSADSGLRELRDLAKHFIHHCTDSNDYLATVDFITKKAVGVIRGAGPVKVGRKIPLGRLSTSGVAHEHMVPDAVILKLLTASPSDPRTANTKTALSRLVFRALVAGPVKKGGNREQVGKLDQAGLTSKLPNPTTLLGCKVSYDEIPFQYWALTRYEAAGLLGELIPITHRARRTLNAYLRWRSLANPSLPPAHQGSAFPPVGLPAGSLPAPAASTSAQQKTGALRPGG